MKKDNKLQKISEREVDYFNEHPVQYSAAVLGLAYGTLLGIGWVAQKVGKNDTKVRLASGANAKRNHHSKVSN